MECFPKVFIGPDCSRSLRDGIAKGLQDRWGNRFNITNGDLIQFKDGDSLYRLGENIRNQEVYLVQPADTDQHFMHLMRMIDAALLASASRITVVFTYFPGRQDRKDRPRVGITAALLARMTMSALGECPSKKIMIFEPHCDQLEMAFNGQSCDKLWATTILLDAYQQKYPIVKEEVAVGGPDPGSIKLVRKTCSIVGLDTYFHGDKKRMEDDRMKIVNIVGDVTNKKVLIRDDMSDTGGTLNEIIRFCESRGAIQADALISHGVLVDPAVEILMKAKQESILRHVFITDSINNDHRQFPEDLITIVPCGDFLANAIFLNATGGSLSELPGMQ